MKVETEKIGTNKVKMQITVDAASFDQSMIVAYNKIKGKLNIPGFRKGKAPKKLIENMYGERVFYEEAFNDAVPKAYAEVVESEGIYPVDRPDVDVINMKEGEDFVFTAEVFVKPEFELGQYKGIEVEKKAYPATEEAVNADIENTRNRNARWIDAEADYEAKDGDKLTIDYKGFLDGNQFEGGSAENYALVLGSHTFIPGFEEQLVGIKPNETKSINVTFPEDYHSEELKGKAVVFEVTVHEIQYKEMPELDDEFAKDVSDFDTFAEYKASVEKRLNEAGEKRADREMENELLKKIADNTQIDIPEGMVNTQIDNMIEDMYYRMQGMGLSFEQYLQYTGTTMEKLRENYRDEAYNTVKIQLIVEKVCVEEGIEATPEEIEAEYAKLAEESHLDVDKVKSSFAGNDSYIKNRVVADKTIDFLKSNAVYVDSAETKEEK